MYNTLAMYCFCAINVLYLKYIHFMANVAFMITLNIRKQGGAAVITIPSDVLRLLNIEVGDTLALDVSGKKLIIRPLKTSRQRYSLAELLQNTSPEDMKALKKETEWFRKEKSIGREI
ncbi:MAG: AbrB/MazE/SpoVT family DNA-binding domain-containing protein [Gammaproteobacteria bacterium]|nr:MAG: AbrB/MazE/SpoVT family DNA-binding domain-containing protein [Gammaproteobacteria bacterium]